MSRDTSRQSAAEGGDSGFPGLLSKLADNRAYGGGEAGVEKDPPGSGRDSNKFRDLWQAAIEALSSDPRSAGPQSVDGGAAGLTATDLAALMQALTGSGALPGGLAAIAGRVATGTETEADAVLMRAALAGHDDGALSPEQRILASLAKVAGRTGEPATSEMRTTTATLTVLRRETHLARAHLVTATHTGGLGAAAQVAAGNPAGLALPDAVTRSSAEGLLPSGNDDLAARTHLVAPQTAVTAADSTQWDAGRGQRQSQGQSPTADLLMAGSTPARADEPALPAGRTDAVVNAGLASGPVQQIADRLASEVSTFVAQAGRSDAPPFVVKHESPVKVLHIQLQPADLGTVTIRMAVKDNVLRLDLEVGRGETAQLIQRDRDALSALLRSAGYLIDGVDVRLAEQSGTGAQAGNNQAGSNQAGMQMQGGGSGSSQSEARLPGERPHEERSSNPFGRGRDGEDEQAGRNPGRGGVYI